MSCEHHGHCHHQEALQQEQIAQHIGNMCCAGQCSHPEHQLLNLEAIIAEQQQLHAAEHMVEKPLEKKIKKKKRTSRGLLQIMLTEPA